MIRVPLSLVFFLLIVGFTACLWVPVTCEVQFTLADTSSQLNVYWKVLGVRVSLMPLVQAASESLAAPLKEEFSGKDFVNQGQRLGRTARLFVQEILSLRLDFALGLVDPFLTATACGGTWALVGSLLGALQANFTLRTPPHVAITPQHHRLGIEMSLHCIFRFRLGQIIRDTIRSLASSMARGLQIKEL